MNACSNFGVLVLDDLTTAAPRGHGQRLDDAIGHSVALELCAQQFDGEDTRVTQRLVEVALVPIQLALRV